MAKSPGRCIFCTGFHLTKEHLFADWLREIFPRSESDTHTMGVAEGTPWRIIQRQGHSGSKKIRTVCKRCNSGWISAVDDAAKYVATPLIRGEPSVITPDMQRVLAGWFAKIAAVADSRNRRRSVVTQPQRTWIMDRQEPPKEWEIWIAPYGGSDYRDLALFQNGGHLDFSPVRGPSKEFSGYAQTTFLGIGKLATLVVADDFPRVDFNIGTFAQIARRIWPIGGEVAWPLPYTMTDIEANAAAHILKHMIANIRDE